MLQIACISESEEFSTSLNQEAGAWPGVAVAAFSSVEEFLQDARGNPFHAIVVSIRAAMKASSVARARLHELESRVPVARVRPETDVASFSGVFGGRSYGELGEMLRDFVPSLRREGSDAPISVILRRHERRPLILNARLIIEGQENSPRLTHTINLSEGGAFVILAEDLRCGSAVRVEFLELGTDAPLPAVVRWRKSWGRCNGGFSGVGIEFDSLSALQSSLLHGFLEVSSHRSEDAPMPQPSTGAQDAAGDELISELDRLLDETGLR